MNRNFSRPRRGMVRRDFRMGAVAPAAPQEYGAKDYFVYSIVRPAGIAPAGTDAGSFNVDQDSDFLWQKATYFVMVANDGFLDGTRPIPGITVTIKDTTSGRDIMTTPVPIPAMFGTGELPFILPVPKLLPKVSTITVNFANITDNTTYSYVGLFFHGQKLFG
jgi:hypothetical protein